MFGGRSQLKAMPLSSKPSGTVKKPTAFGANGSREEVPGYLKAGAEQLYYVLHTVQAPKLRMLLAGPFATERCASYNPWVRWARFLAERGIEALRLDYRGVGESTGEFEKMSFATWREDVRIAAEWLKRRDPPCPLVLHGLGVGALLADGLFQTGLGDGFLLWSPPTGGEEALRQAFTGRLLRDYSLADKSKRRKWQDYVRLLELGESIEVDGYMVSGHLWRESRDMRLSLPISKESEASGGEPRPWKMVKLDKTTEPLIPGLGRWLALNPRVEERGVPINPDLRSFFGSNLTWIEGTFL